MIAEEPAMDRRGELSAPPRHRSSLSTSSGADAPFRVTECSASRRSDVKKVRIAVAVLGLVLVLTACEQWPGDLGSSGSPVAQQRDAGQESGSGSGSPVAASAGGAGAVPAAGGCVPSDDRYSGLPGCWPGGQAATVSRVVDGDTFRLTDGREVQLIGVDAPELDECAGQAAKDHARFRVEGRDVVLHAEDGVDRDRSGRPLFYVQYTGPAGVVFDLGYSLAYNGLGVHYPSYAGNDRYTANVQEAAWRADVLNLGMFAVGCGEQTTAPTTDSDDDARDERAAAASAPEPGPRARPRPHVQPQSAPEPEPVRATNCHPSYTPCVPDGPDLDCGEIGFAVRVIGPDEFRLDGDNDGRGCDSYR